MDKIWRQVVDMVYVHINLCLYPQRLCCNGLPSLVGNLLYIHYVVDLHLSIAVSGSRNRW